MKLVFYFFCIVLLLQGFVEINSIPVDSGELNTELGCPEGCRPVPGFKPPPNSGCPPGPGFKPPPNSGCPPGCVMIIIHKGIA
ncbi:hypothetical protein QE152_g929 [Popillia japonica]|uniref:Uncharacterized protein n=1 Tax=Popillia japonica TaxID=7064 RepID=A0AAW1NB20_POPJA